MPSLVIAQTSVHVTKVSVSFRKMDLKMTLLQEHRNSVVDLKVVDLEVCLPAIQPQQFPQRTVLPSCENRASKDDLPS